MKQRLYGFVQGRDVYILVHFPFLSLLSLHKVWENPELEVSSSNPVVLVHLSLLNGSVPGKWSSEWISLSFVLLVKLPVLFVYVWMEKGKYSNIFTVRHHLDIIRRAGAELHLLSYIDIRCPSTVSLWIASILSLLQILLFGNEVQQFKKEKKKEKRKQFSKKKEMKILKSIKSAGRGRNSLIWVKCVYIAPGIGERWQISICYGIVT